MPTTKSVAIVTGASQGIGQATALRLARDFSVIVLVAREKEKLEKTAAGVTTVGAEAMVVALDLREPNRQRSSQKEHSNALAESMLSLTSREPCRRLIYFR